MSRYNWKKNNLDYNLNDHIEKNGYAGLISTDDVYNYKYKLKCCSCSHRIDSQSFKLSACFRDNGKVIDEEEFNFSKYANYGKCEEIL